MVTDGCQIINGAGAVADMFCNAYIIPDTSTIRLSYNDVSAVVHGERPSSDCLAATDIPQEKLDAMSEQAFDDQCTGANPRYPLVEEIAQLYKCAYYGKA